MGDPGLRGCCGETKRKGKLRPCAQKAIWYVAGKYYCFYHNPLDPHKFAQGYTKKGRQNG